MVHNINGAQFKKEIPYIQEGEILIVKATGDAEDKQLCFMLAPRFTPRETPDY